MSPCWTYVDSTPTSARRSSLSTSSRPRWRPWPALERFAVYDLGGGLGIRYVPEDVAPSVEEYAERLVAAVHRHLGTDVELLVEPGRSLVGPHVVTAYRVVTVKRGVRTHVAVDGGMGDNLEVALYGQPFHPAVIDRPGHAEICDVVGRHCESGDTFVRDHPLVPPPWATSWWCPRPAPTASRCPTTTTALFDRRSCSARTVRRSLAVRRETFADLLGRDQLVARG